MATPTGIALLRDGVHRVCREWSSDGGSDVPLDMLEQQGNALPAVEYTTRTGEPVVVRSLAVNGRLFVHFVKNQVSTRVDLRVAEYVAASDSSIPDSDPRYLRWRGCMCKMELLRWRLERSALAIFEPQAVAPTAMAAELSKLSESLVLRVCGFLRAPEFCRLTQTNKFLHLADSKEPLWQTFVAQVVCVPDFPQTARPIGRDWKQLYVLTLESKRRRARELTLARQRMWGPFEIPIIHPQFRFPPPPGPQLDWDSDLDPFFVPRHGRNEPPGHVGLTLGRGVL